MYNSAPGALGNLTPNSKEHQISTFVNEVYQTAGSAALFNLFENLCAEQFFSNAGTNFLATLFTLDILRENGFFSVVQFCLQPFWE
ncbi:hypothetical protein EDS67_06270 [candidate division KSB1 bacterium]|nr:MAG: hypothetical protein EDS67_06270 [candidate division KSB1 bacterium]